jgi:HNH endonuclease
MLHYDPTPTTCKLCGKLFGADPWKLRNGLVKYCSLACLGRAKYKDEVKLFWANIVKTRHCWIWTGAVAGRGYGQIYTFKRQVSVHRLSWEIHFGPIPKGRFILHRCDFKICCAPRHLWLGSHRDNMADARRKGHMRGGTTRRPFSQCDVRRIALLAKLGMSQHKIQKIFTWGTKSDIRKIIERTTQNIIP